MNTHTPTLHVRAANDFSMPGRVKTAALGAAGWLSLAAAPFFAIMGLLTAVLCPPDMLCSATHGASLLGGMSPMYLLMSAFHSTPWLRLISSRIPHPEDR